jgi:hypothetical protein
MANATSQGARENTPEYIAYRLFQHVACVERKSIDGTGATAGLADRKWILDTYSECLMAVLAPDARLSGKEAISVTISPEDAAL